MADIVNLRKARKAKKHSMKNRNAENNRLKFGQTKAQKKKNQLNKNRHQYRLDGKCLKSDD